ncbi:Dna2-domain-containing protein [Fomitiporia mediterranea MF3/22]|uniref:Dna2-domain-containing protein n=1 Tax=Fomitiporia mediterranea (strain MF3/22) TaxID=694068 RepID=UPI0004407D95|nr:Dna2-domain-containing protein [Fomitiporia mediterranea MF3/22]EJD05682.1 Dna2-domain-containing protein [Fomitiporia mediterranea MF3/22]
MPSSRHSAQDEAVFMQELLSGVDSSFFDAVPSPDPTPKKRKRPTEELSENKHLSGQKENANVVFESAKKKPRALGSQDYDIAALLEGAEDWDWDDMLSPVRKKPAVRMAIPSTPDPSASVFRCTVESIEHDRLTKKLLVVSEKESKCRTVTLKDDWIQTDVSTGDTIHVIGVFTPRDEDITISAKRNLLIQHPDVLMTSTSIAGAPHCARRSLLSLLMRSSSGKTRSLVWGNILHEVMQRCLSSQRWDAPSIEAFIDETIQKGLTELVHIDVGVEEARIEINKRAGGLKAFGERFLGEVPKANAYLSNTRDGQGKVSRLAITHLHDVEEEIWAPKYGLKGKLDATVQVRIDEETKGLNLKHGQLPLPSQTITTTMPLEIKTGRAIAGMEHRAQTMLYTLLMAERYGTPLPSPISGSSCHGSPPGGLLFYTQSEEVIRVPPGWNELRGLIMARNELANYLMRRSRRRKKSFEEANSKESMHEEKPAEVPFLPPTIDQERACGRCYVADACMLYRKAVEGVKDNYSPIAALYELKTGHLSENQLMFFKQWENLISLEEQDMTRFRKEIWTLGATEREKSGRCLADMVLDPTFDATSAQDNARIHRYTYRFTRRPRSPSVLKDASSSSSPSLLHGHVTSGEPVVISVLGDPRLVALARGYVLDLNPESIVVGCDHSLSPGSLKSWSSFPLAQEDIAFRIDKDDLLGGMGRVRDNLAQLFYVSSPRRLLEQIVDLKPPEFDAECHIPMDAALDGLNACQQHALEHCLRARDYALILGMPGTGKTTTVAHMIKVLVEMGKTVLLTSYTHSAVDTILLKLKETAKFGILRLGNKDKVHPNVQEFTLNAGERATTVEQLEHQLLRPPVVAATALSTDHKEARKGGFDVSLFRRLSSAHPTAVVDLTYQYRMNANIMLLSNKLIYSDRLKCGSAEIADQSLVIPNAVEHGRSCSTNDSSCWIQTIIDESCKAIFVDTDALPALDSRVGDLVQNEVEASLVQQLTLALLNGGVREEQIGIISLYRQQIKLLSRLLLDNKGIEILTADRSQGRDKDCIIISLVRANEENQIGDLLKDWRRINVAFTRARAKLVIFGSRKTLKASPLLSDFFGLMEERGWVLTLPTGADTLHSYATASIEANEQDSSKYGPPKSSIAGGRNVAHPKKTKQVTLENSLLRARPVLRDILNGTK